MPLFLARLTLIPIKSLSISFRLNSTSITTILKRRGCLTVPRLTLMSLIKMMLVMVSVDAISKTFGLLRFLLRLSFLDRKSGSAGMPRLRATSYAVLGLKKIKTKHVRAHVYTTYSKKKLYTYTVVYKNEE